MADDIRVITGLLGRFTERAIARLSVNVTAELIEATPVDTGWARANWVPAIGSPFDVDAPNDGEGIAVDSRRGDQQRGTASVLAYRLSNGPVYISNNVPYITSLNEGSSSQAPAAFVQSAIAAGVKKTV